MTLSIQFLILILNKSYLFPVKLNLCGCRYRNTWVRSNISSIPTFPGATLQCNATLTDYAGSLSPSVVFAQVVTGRNNVLPDLKLAPQQEVQWISNECTALEYEIYGPQNTSVILQLSIKHGSDLEPISITLQWCEAGFFVAKRLHWLITVRVLRLLVLFWSNM